MVELKKIIILDNEMEAQIMESILEEQEIPFVIESYYDKAYDGIFTMQKGWGYIEAEPEYEPEIKSIYQQMREETLEDPE